MFTAGKMASQLPASLVAFLILLMLVGIYGKQAMEWLLLKLYDFLTGLRS
jgi:hypothetical protein